jgi:hypothetical protein
MGFGAIAAAGVSVEVVDQHVRRKDQIFCY